METEPITLSYPDPKSTRRAASICSFATVVSVAISYTVLLAISILKSELFPETEISDSLWLIVNTAVTDLIALPLAWVLLLRRVPRHDAAEDGMTKTPLLFGKLMFYLPCAYALLMAGALTGRLIGWLLGDGLADVVSEAIMPVSPWVTLLCAVIVGPIAEELFFRKAMIDRLSGFHPTDAILLSALLFGLMHGNLTQFLYAFPIGVLFGIIYYRTQNIGYTILLHIGVNALGGLIPQLVEMWSESVSSFSEGLGTLVVLFYGQIVIALCVVGLIFLIRRRRQFLPIPTQKLRFRRPFYLNAGWIVACVLLSGLFILNEILL